MTPEECQATLNRWFDTNAVEALTKAIAQFQAERHTSRQPIESVPQTRRKKPSRRRIKARLRLGKWVSKLEIVNHNLTSYMLKFRYEAHDYLYFIRRTL